MAREHVDEQAAFARLVTGSQQANLKLRMVAQQIVASITDADAGELEAYLHGALTMTDYQHDVAAHALNERLAELGRQDRVS